MPNRHDARAMREAMERLHSVGAFTAPGNPDFLRAIHLSEIVRKQCAVPDDRIPAVVAATARMFNAALERAKRLP